MIDLGETDWAVELLTAVLAGSTPQELHWFETDNSLDPIRDAPRYKSRVAEATERFSKLRQLNPDT